MTLTAQSIIDVLELAPHPEGGWYRETFRDAPDRGRAKSTAIYFLLEAGKISAWHRIDAAEVWHWHAGAPLELTVAGSGRAQVTILGTDLAAGHRPQGIVPAGAWQTSRTLGDWTLVGCTVAPGFEFAQFELAPPGFDPKA